MSIYTGSPANDRFMVDDTNDVIIENPNEGKDIVSSMVDYTLPANVENLLLTGIDNLNGAGNESNNFLTGNIGLNSLYGYSGNDTLKGGLGSDSLFGGLGNDWYVLSDLSDQITENPGEGRDIVLSPFSYTLPANVENLILAGNSNLDGNGNDLANFITGNMGNNNLYGYSGHDTLKGDAGNDNLFGGTGNDWYLIDDANATIIENPGEGKDIVKSSISYTLPANTEKLFLDGSYIIDATGNDLKNELIGNSAVNHINGLGGNDFIEGGLGSDLLSGGEGRDIFCLMYLDGPDTITDFSVKDDTIQLKGAAFSAIGKAGVLAASQFEIGTQASDADDFVLYDNITGTVFYDADGNGAQTPVQIAIVGAGLALTHADFVVNFSGMSK